MEKLFSLRKCKQILRGVYKQYRRRQTKLSGEGQLALYEKMHALQDAIMAKDRAQATQEAKAINGLVQTHMYRPGWLRNLQGILGLAIVLGAAILIRQVWFELYQIPTGSMRPTFKEIDRVVVNKAPFGINIPFMPRHLTFDENNVKRGEIVVLTTAGMNLKDSDMLYFYLFPGKKQYVKRLMGKPGDTLYFYGGKIYGIDKTGKDISPELQPEKLQSIHHVPFIHLEGKPKMPGQPRSGVYSPMLLEQMGQPVAQLTAKPGGRVEGKMLPNPNKPTYIENAIDDYSDLWGFRNYAQSRLLTPHQARSYHQDSILPSAPLYLELTHHPSLKKGRLTQNYKGHLIPTIGTSKSVLPLSEKNINTLFRSLTTDRFIVENGIARRYGSGQKYHPSYPKLTGVADGTYEYILGVPYRVYTQGVVKQLAPDHPLAQYDQNRLLTLYNMGIEFSQYVSPQSRDQILPSRFAYFNQGTLYSMNMPIVERGEANLQAFLKHEQSKENSAPTFAPYAAFKDHGPPLTSSGTIDREFIMRYGMTIPEKHYLALGDNYPSSGDSRDFGFVPEGNLRGSPLFIFSPPGSRLGALPQVYSDFFTFTNMLIWTLGLVAFGIGWRYQKRNTHLPIDFHPPKVVNPVTT